MHRLALLLLLLLATPVHAAEMAIYLKNQQSRAIAAELFSRDSQTVWPGGEKVYLLDPAEKKSVPIACEAGEEICYGAWVAGNDGIAFGTGPDHDRLCENCCFICAEKGSATILVGE